MSWETTAKAKLNSINGAIPEKWRLATIPSIQQRKDVTGPYMKDHLSDREVEITETDAVDIVKKTCSGDWQAEEVVTAFCHRASIAHQLTMCLHEVFFKAAIEDARKLDIYFAEHKAPIGPLHGLPVSLKDQFHVKGVETSMGYTGWIGTFEGQKGTKKEKVFESEMVKELRASGAVLYCKTSVPHTLMSGETVNNIIGWTMNPRNRHLSSGGSSGGEGALIGLKGSPVGFGTDIGGSIRIPSAFNGLYGIRPSAGRLPYEGMANSMDGQNSVVSVVGPLSHSAASLRLVIKALLSQQPWLHDPLVHEIPWRDSQEHEISELIKTKNLCFGIMKHDGTITPHPPVQRAMEIVSRVIERLGHKTMKWNPPPHNPGNEITTNAWKYDGGLNIHNAFDLSGEPMADQVSATYGKKPIEQANATQIHANNVAKREYQKAYMEYWNNTVDVTGSGRSVDAIVVPVAPFAAAREKRYKYYGYSTIFNTLDYTSCVIPVTDVDKHVDSIDNDFKPLNELDRDIMQDYDADLYDGAHVAVQIVGRRLQEEKVLALAEYIGSAVVIVARLERGEAINGTSILRDMADSATPNSTTGKLPSIKDKQCPFCNQTFTSSSLGRHLDLYIREKNAKPPDDVHDVEEIKKIRGGITRRQARSSRKRDDSTPSSTKATPQREQRSPSIHKAYTSMRTDESGAVKTYFHTANWQATGVINDLPPTPREEQAAHFQRGTPSRRASVKEELAHRQAGLEERDRGRAAELALKEVLESVKAANAKAYPSSPFEFNFFSLSLPQMYLRCLSPPPDLLSGPPALHEASWTVNPPGTADYEALRGWLHDKLHDWKRRRDNVQFGNNGSLSGVNAQTPVSADNSPTHNEEAMYYDHLSKAHHKWTDLTPQVREAQWHYECADAYAREQERHQVTTRALEHAEQEIRLLRNQIAQMNSHILPPEFLQFTPTALPFTSEARSHLPDTTNTSPYDFDALIAKWKSRIRCARSTQIPLPAAAPWPPPSHQQHHPHHNHHHQATPSNGSGTNRFEFLQRAAAQESQDRGQREPAEDEETRGDMEDAPGEEDDDDDAAYEQDQQQQRKASDPHRGDQDTSNSEQPQARGGRRLVGFGTGFRGSEEGTQGRDVEMGST